MLSLNTLVKPIRRLLGSLASLALVAALLTLTSGQASADLGTGGVVWGPDTAVSTLGLDVEPESLVYDISENGTTVVAMWARRSAGGSMNYIMQMAVGTIGSGSQIVWGPVRDLGTQMSNSIPGAVSVSADGLKVALVYPVDATGQGNSLFLGTANVAPVSSGSRDISNLATSSDSMISSPNPVVVTRLRVQMSDDGSKAVASFIWADNANISLRSAYYDATAQGAGVSNGWASPVSLASLGSLSRSVALRLSPDGRTAVIVYENGDLFSYSGSVANGTLTWSQAPATIVIAGVNQQGSGGLNLEVTEDGSRGFVTWKLQEGSGPNAIATIVYLTASISGSTATWSTPAVVSRSDRDPALPNFSLYHEVVSLVMSDDGATVGVAWDRIGDDGSTYLSEVYLRLGGFTGNGFAWSGPATMISPSGVEEYLFELTSSTDASTMFLTSTNGNTVTRTLSVAGGNANWSADQTTPTGPDPVFRFSPSGDRIVMMYIDNTDVGSYLGTPTFPVAPPTTAPATTSPEITAPATTGPETTAPTSAPATTTPTTVAADSLPATGRQSNSMMLNALLVTLLGATFISTKRRLRTR
jgi:hypothetical protein